MSGTKQSKSRSKLLVSKDVVSKHVTAVTLVGGTAILADTKNSLEVFDEKGVSLGFIALFDTATLV